MRDWINAVRILNEDSEQLKALVRSDQHERKLYQTFINDRCDGDYQSGARRYAEQMNRSPDDLFGERARLDAFTEERFDFSTFAEDDWHNYWLLAQHCDFDRAFQKQALDLIIQHCGMSEEARFLSDRITCGCTGTQQFNTQDICTKD